MYQYFNPHPKGTTTQVGDCVKRAIVVATGMSYHKAQQALNAYKKITGAKSFNQNRNAHRYVEEVLGAKRIIPPFPMTAEEFCQTQPRGRYILDMVGHWSACVDNCIYDTWDCSNQTLNFAYEITTEPYTPPDLSNQIFKYCCTSERISDTQTKIRIYDGNGAFTERVIPSELTGGYVRCLQDSHYNYIEL